MKVLHNVGFVWSCIIILENETLTYCSNTKRESHWLYGDGYANAKPNVLALDPQLLISFLSYFFAHPNLLKLICGSDVDMIRNNFCVFL